MINSIETSIETQNENVDASRNINSNAARKRIRNQFVNDTFKWNICKFNDDYEISYDDSFDLKFRFRLRSSEDVINPHINSDGVACVTLNNREEFLHVIVSTQMFEHNRSSTRMIKRTYEYIDNLPETAFQIKQVLNIDLNERYYYDPESENIYLRNSRGSEKYKIVNPSANGTCKQYSILTVDGTYKRISSYKLIDALNKMQK